MERFSLKTRSDLLILRLDSERWQFTMERCGEILLKSKVHETVQKSPLFPICDLLRLFET